jgi:hypothetical protein
MQISSMTTTLRYAPKPIHTNISCMPFRMGDLAHICSLHAHFAYVTPSQHKYRFFSTTPSLLRRSVPGIQNGAGGTAYGAAL